VESAPRAYRLKRRFSYFKEHAMSQTPNTAIAAIGIDIGGQKGDSPISVRDSLPATHQPTVD
jgi:hypothetical protein